MGFAEQKSPFPAGTGLLLVGHGSREAQGTDEFLSTVQLVREQLAPLPVEPSFLEFAQPTISEGLSALVERGTRQVRVVPVLLFAAGHIRRDIPAAVAVAAAQHPGVETRQCEHLGCHPALVEVSKLRCTEALEPRPPIAPAETELLLVGRGSHEAEATAEMHEFARLRHDVTLAARTSVGFVAMADPPFETALNQAALRAPRRVIVQPHLLFGGVLNDRVAATVAGLAQAHADIDWVVTRHLGPSSLVLQAILDRARGESA